MASNTFGDPADVLFNEDFFDYLDGLFWRDLLDSVDAIFEAAELFLKRFIEEDEFVSFSDAIVGIWEDVKDWSHQDCRENAA
jgi:hypothetical protein